MSSEEELRCEKCNDFIGEDDVHYVLFNGEISDDVICIGCINTIQTNNIVKEN